MATADVNNNSNGNNVSQHNIDANVHIVPQYIQSLQMLKLANNNNDNINNSNNTNIIATIVTILKTIIIILKLDNAGNGTSDLITAMVRGNNSNLWQDGCGVD